MHVVTAMQGSKHPLYQSVAWKRARHAVLVRDGFRCVVCGADVRGKGAARVDHIQRLADRPDLGLHLPNLRTLCVGCDNRNHAERGGANPRRGSDDHGQPLDPAHPWNGDPFAVLDDSGQATGQTLGTGAGAGEAEGEAPPSSPYPTLDPSRW
ncbi:HNH endonuclease [Cupriavidus sp. DL-D2]|uniref:HNH endonuclease n=1 Tax=Cupriavidus sp. DL-D2 TaxID=3144974 RepID=UPI0032148593